MSDLTRTYRCPQCGYDGFSSSAIKSPVDVNVQWGCPVCQARGVTVWLKETSDPRDGDAAPGAAYTCRCGQKCYYGRHHECIVHWRDGARL